MGGQAVAAVVAVVAVVVAAALAFVKKVNDTSCLLLLSLREDFHSIIHVEQKKESEKERVN
jgi:hypothetical protein